MTRKHRWARPDDHDDAEITASTHGLVDPPPETGAPVGITLTVLQGDASAPVFLLDGSGGVIGRHHAAEVQLLDPTISREHARVAVVDGVFTIEELGSSNGTTVDCRWVEGRVQLRDGCRIRLGGYTTLQATVVDEAGARSVRTIQEQMFTDALTRTGNRRLLKQRLREEMSYTLRHGTPFGILMADIDHFKQVNDRHGHAVGDRVLAEVARVLKESVRDEDSVYRYGGEEFCILLRGVTRGGLDIAAERIRVGLEYLAVPTDQGPVRLTASIGGTCLDAEEAVILVTMDTEGDEDHDELHGHILLEQADMALYEAKRNGRNQVVVR